MAQWKLQNPDATIEELEKIDTKYCNEHSYRNIEFYIRKYPNKTIEKCEQLRKEFHDKLKTCRKRENNKTCIEYWRSHYPDKSEEEVDKMYREFQGSNAVTLDRYKEKYGDELGVEKFNERQHSWLTAVYLNMAINGDGRSPQSKFAVHCISEVCKH